MRYPCFHLTNPLRERVDVKGWRQAPPTVVHMKKSVIVLRVGRIELAPPIEARASSQKAVAVRVCHELSER